MKKYSDGEGQTMLLQREGCRTLKTAANLNEEIHSFGGAGCATIEGGVPRQGGNNNTTE